MVIFVRLKTGTFVTKIAAVFMRPSKGEALATTIGKTIHLHNISTQDFIARRAFLRHELQHCIQYHTTRFFLLKYIWETMRHGYFQNLYEVEARVQSTADFPAGYAVYDDKMLVMYHEDYTSTFGNEGAPSTVELKEKTGLKFSKTPKIYLR
jgi:hypothetical protein